MYLYMTCMKWPIAGAVWCRTALHIHTDMYIYILYIYIPAELLLFALSCQNLILASAEHQFLVEKWGLWPRVWNFCVDIPSTIVFSSRTPKCYAVILSNHIKSVWNTWQWLQQIMWVFPPPLKGAHIMKDLLIHSGSFGVDQVVGNRIVH